MWYLRSGKRRRRKARRSGCAGAHERCHPSPGAGQRGILRQRERRSGGAPAGHRPHSRLPDGGHFSHPSQKDRIAKRYLEVFEQLEVLNDLLA